MSLKAALVAALKADATLAALHGGRVSASHPPRGSALPSVTVRAASDARGKDLSGHTDQRVARVLFVIRASSDYSAETVARALDAFLPALAKTTSGDVTFRTVLQAAETEDYAQPGDGTDQGPRLRVVDYRIDYFLVL